MPVAEVETITENESPFHHYVPGERPRSDGAFFELLLSRVVAQDGALPEFEVVWPRVVQALAGMNIFRLAHISGREMAEAVGSVGGEFSRRLGDKSDVLVSWAESFWRIRQIYGSFRQYVRSFDTDGFEALRTDLIQRLPGLSPEFLTAFLREAGEKIPGQPQEKTAPGPRKAQAATGKQGQPASKGAGGNRGDRGRQRQPQSPPAKPQPAAAVQSAPETKPQSPDGDKGQPSKRRRRRFFRRRPSGGQGKGGQSQAPQPA